MLFILGSLFKLNKNVKIKITYFKLGCDSMHDASIDSFDWTLVISFWDTLSVLKRHIVWLSKRLYLKPQPIQYSTLRQSPV